MLGAHRCKLRVCLRALDSKKSNSTQTPLHLCIPLQQFYSIIFGGAVLHRSYRPTSFHPTRSIVQAAAHLAHLSLPHFHVAPT